MLTTAVKINFILHFILLFFSQYGIRKKVNKYIKKYAEKPKVEELIGLIKSGKKLTMAETKANLTDLVITFFI